MHRRPASKEPGRKPPPFYPYIINYMDTDDTERVERLTKLNEL